MFDGNQMGLMTWNDNHAELVVERSEFHHNRVASTYKDGDPVGHQIYVGSIGRFTLIDSYVHAGAHGHLVKTRARENRIVNNRLTDEARERRATSWSSRTAASLLCWGTSSSKVRTAKTGTLFHMVPKATLGRETSCIW